MPPAMAPAGGTTFRTLLKHAMRARQQRILLLTLLTTHALVSLSFGSMYALVRPCVWAGSLAIVALVAMPLLLRRRQQLIHQTPSQDIAYPRTHTRGAYWLAVLRSINVWHYVARHAASAALLALLYSATAVHAYGWGHALAPTVFVPSHDAYYINESFVVLLLMAAGAGAAFAWSDAFHSPLAIGTVPPFDPDTIVHPVSLRVRTLRTLGVRVPQALVLLPWLLVPFGMYVASRDAFWSALLRIVGVESTVRPYVVPSFRLAFRPAHLLLRLAPVLAGTLTLFACVYTLFDVYWTTPLMPLTAHARDPNATLIAGLQDRHPFFAAHAFSELARIAMYDRARRQALFDDVQRMHGRPVAWNSVVAACTQRLDAFLCTPPAAAVGAAAAAAPPAAATPVPPVPPVAPRHAVAPSVWSALAQVPSAPPAAPAPPPPPPTPPAADTALFKLLRIALYAAQGAARAVLQCMPSDAKHALVPQTVHLAFAAPSPALILDTELLASRAIVCWAALALHHLTVASLTEDRYGSVQKDVAPLVQRLVQAHERLQRVRQRVERDALAADHQLVREAQVVRSALHDAGADAATFSTSYAPFYNELQMTWQVRYATLDAALGQSAQQILQAFAPYGIQA